MEGRDPWPIKRTGSDVPKGNLSQHQMSEPLPVSYSEDTSLIRTGRTVSTEASEETWVPNHLGLDELRLKPRVRPEGCGKSRPFCVVWSHDRRNWSELAMWKVAGNRYFFDYTTSGCYCFIFAQHVRSSNIDHIMKHIGYSYCCFDNSILLTSWVTSKVGRFNGAVV